MAIHVTHLKIAHDGHIVLALDNWNVATPAHGIISGPSGSGKTTLLYALGGLIQPQSGRITIGKDEITQLKQGAIDRWRGQHVGFVFQDLHIIPHLSVLQNITLAGHLVDKPIDQKWLQTITHLLGLDALMHRYGYQLSTGERQRVAIARAIAYRPALLLADEPTSGLDDKNAYAVIDLLQQAAEKAQSSLLIATHDSRLKEKIPTLLALGETS